MSAIDTISRTSDGSERIGLRRRMLILVGLYDLAAERRRTRRALEGLSDTQLRDIGLTRPQAMAEARRGFWG